MGDFRIGAALMAVAASVGGLIAGGSAWSQQPASRPVHVLELFTSQGCSSCPPADALLGAYAARDDVIALSLPVDYWDRLGWKDTFAKAEYTKRQRAYAQARGDGEVYTPQVVVNGRAHVVGSVRREIDGSIALTARDTAARRVPLSVEFQGDDMIVHVGAAVAGSTGATGQLLLAVVQDKGTVAIGRGENAGREVTYHNVVRDLKPIGAWTGSSASLRIPRADTAGSCCETLAVLLQQGQGGPILAAAKIARPKSKTSG